MMEKKIPTKGQPLIKEEKKEIKIIKSDSSVSIIFPHIIPATSPLPTASAEEEIIKVMNGGKLDSWYKGRTLVHTSEYAETHRFVEAAGISFASHYPFILSPDTVWIMIAQGFAVHVNKFSAELRQKLSLPEEKIKLEVIRNDFVKGKNNPWIDVFEEFSTKIKEHIGENIHQTLISNFSTTTRISKSISEIILLDTFQNFFDFRFGSRCGFPEIIIKGTVNDWESVKQRALSLEKYDLDWWIPNLVPILDQFISLYKEDNNISDETYDFWSSFFKLKNDSGGPYITGWINTLLPYIADSTGYEENCFVSSWKKSMKRSFGGGMKSQQLTSGISAAPFIWDCFGDIYKMKFNGGFVGVYQDPNTLSIEPELGWVVVEQKESS